MLLVSPARSETPVHIPLITEEDASALPESIQDATLFRRRPFITSYWDTAPVLRICNASRVSKGRALRAKSFWENLGYSIEEVIMDPGSLACSSGGLSGEITVMLVRADVPMGENIALTKTYYYTASRRIIRAQIFIHSFASSKDRILEHEIGHALGWMHFNRSYHIMHREYNRGGHDTTGIRHSDYVSQYERIQEEI